MDLGCIHYYYGMGKGKTTAATGLALRALGSGIPVTIVQFLKDGNSGECALLSQLGANVLAGKAAQCFYDKMSQTEKDDTRLLHDKHMRIALCADGLLVLDEIGSALTLGAVDEELVFELLRNHGKNEVVMTGHAPLQLLVDAADYVTEMVCHKHPYSLGISARRGIEF